MNGGGNMIDENYIGDRIAVLRISKKVSAREMSLSLGQSQNYITTIENHKSYPSMQMFLYICEYLNISPKDFFDDETKCPQMIDETVRSVKRLSKEQQKLLIDLAKEMK